MQEHIYQKLWFKNSILISLPVIISVIGAAFSFIKSNIVKAILATIMFILLICLVVAVIVFSIQDDKMAKAYDQLKNDKMELANILAHMENNFKTSTFTISTFSSMAEIWAKSINSFAINVRNNGSISDKAWNKVRLMDSICLQCKNMIERYCNNSKDSKVSVGFISYRKDADGEEWVYMVSHSNMGSNRPSACKEEIKLSECLYHYGKLIKDKISDIEVAINNEEILRIFNNVSIGNDLSKYTQYIAIPVYCTSNKLLGIFQVVTKYDYYIEKEKVNLIEFATNNIIPYSNMIVLVDKIYKGLYTSPTEIKKEE